jgi:hypothetical protein
MVLQRIGLDLLVHEGLGRTDQHRPRRHPRAFAQQLQALGGLEMLEDVDGHDQLVASVGHAREHLQRLADDPVRVGPVVHRGAVQGEALDAVDATPPGRTRPLARRCVGRHVEEFDVLEIGAQQEPVLPHARAHIEHGQGLQAFRKADDGAQLTAVAERHGLAGLRRRRGRPS